MPFLIVQFAYKRSFGPARARQRTRVCETSWSLQAQGALEIAGFMSFLRGGPSSALCKGKGNPQPARAAIDGKLSVKRSSAIRVRGNSVPRPSRRTERQHEGKRIQA